MSQPTHNDFRTNQALTDISLAHFQEAKTFVSNMVFPRHNVPNSGGIIRGLSVADTLRDPIALQSEGTAANESGYELTETEYQTRKYSTSTPVTDEQIADADDAIMPVTATTMTLSNWGLINQETRWRDAFFRMSDGTNNIWGNNLAGVSSGPVAGTSTLQWDNDNADIPLAIEQAIDTVAENSGIRPNTLILGKKTYTAMKNNDSIIDRIDGGATPDNPAHANLVNMAALFGLDKIYVGSATGNSAAEGATANFGYILGPHALLTYVAPEMAPGLFRPSSARLFQWTGYLGAASGPTGFTIDSIRDGLRDQTVYRIRAHQHMKVMEPSLGLFFNNIVPA